MILKRSSSLSNKVNWHFYDLLIVNNVRNIFTICKSLLLNVIKIYHQFTKTSWNLLKFPEIAISRFKSREM